MEVTEEIVTKALACIDAGLVNGLGKAKPGMMCVEAVWCHVLGMSHGDQPTTCTISAGISYGIRLNDASWSSKDARAKGMRRYGIAQAGSAGVVDDVAWVRTLMLLRIQRVLPMALRAAAWCHPKREHTDALCAAADKCASSADLTDAIANARAARDVARSARADAAAYAASPAAAAAAAAAAADADAYAAAAAYAAADADVAAYAYAAAAAAAYAAAASPAARDFILEEAAECGVLAFQQLGSPGCAYLHLTPRDS